MSEQVHYMVTHGRYNFDILTSEGVYDTENARRQLAEKELGRNALMLSSDAPYALQAAAMLGTSLEAEIVSSARIRSGGLNPQGIDELDDWIELSLAEAGVRRHEEQKLVLVTHPPLIAVATGHPRLKAFNVVKHGEVYEYTPGTWKNAEYDPVCTSVIENLMKL